MPAAGRPLGWLHQPLEPTDICQGFRSYMIVVKDAKKHAKFVGNLLKHHI
jgi:hypothetical protein